jgi:hypothetical protein
VLGRADEAAAPHQRQVLAVLGRVGGDDQHLVVAQQIVRHRVGELQTVKDVAVTGRVVH